VADRLGSLFFAPHSSLITFRPKVSEMDPGNPLIVVICQSPTPSSRLWIFPVGRWKDAGWAEGLSVAFFGRRVRQKIGCETALICAGDLFW